MTLKPELRLTCQENIKLSYYLKRLIDVDSLKDLQVFSLMSFPVFFSIFQHVD